LTSELKNPKKIFFGWYVVAAAALINVYGAGIWFYGFPIFFKALRDEFGWTAAAGALVISLSRLEGGIEAPIIGWAVDKYGPRRLAVVGAVIAGSGFIVMSRVRDFDVGPIHISALVAFFILYAGWMSVGYNTGFGHASVAAVNAWFIRKRSRAFAFFSLGAGGSGFTVMLLGWLVSNYGWRDAAFLAGVGVFIIVIPLSLLLRHKPEQYGYLPDGDDPEVLGSEDLSPSSSGQRGPSSVKIEWPNYDFSVKETIYTFAFWMLMIGTGARAIAMGSVVIHEVVYLTEVRNIPLIQASTALGAMVSVSLLGRLFFGFLGDYVDKRYIMIFTIVLQAVGIYILAEATTMAQVWVFVVVYGIAYGGAIPIFMAIIGEYFGRKNYATIRGVIQFCHMPTAVLGPVFAGWIYDTTGSYDTAFMSFIVALIVSVGFIFFARRPKPPQLPSTESDDA
jgi:MFS family permease